MATLIHSGTQRLTIACIAATWVMDHDRELALLMLHAVDHDTVESWSAVHDRLNVLGNFDGADRIRKLIQAKGE